MTDAGPQVHPRVREQSARVPEADEYAEIAARWRPHALAEDARDLDGLVATRSTDRVDELVAGDVEPGHRREGHDGARRCSTAFPGAFPDVQFHLQDITIGPQGVTKGADVVGTHRGDVAGWPATGERLSFTMVVVVPRSREQRRFDGERVLAVRGHDPSDT